MADMIIKRMPSSARGTDDSTVEATHNYRVIFEDELFHYAEEALLHPDIPQKGDRHPLSQFSYLVADAPTVSNGRSTDGAVQPNVFDVQVNYRKTDPQSPQSKSENLIYQRPKLIPITESVQIPRDEDADGKLWATTAGEQFDPWIEEVDTLAYIVTWNSKEFDPDLAIKYKNKVNNTRVKIDGAWYKAKFVKIRYWKATPDIFVSSSGKQTSYWKNECRIVIAHDDELGWVVRKRNRGRIIVKNGKTLSLRPGAGDLIDGLRDINEAGDGPTSEPHYELFEFCKPISFKPFKWAGRR